MAEEVDLSFLDQKDEEEQDSKTPKPEELGYALRKEQKARREAEKQLAELVKFRDEQLAKARTEALKSAGLSDGQAKYFQGEVTPEAIEAYKVDLGIVEQPKETEEVPTAEETIRPAAPSFTPTPQAGSTIGGKLMSPADLMKLLKTDPAQADRLVAEGKVALETEL